MGTSRKQKRALRVRQKVADRQSKRTQIRQLLRELDGMEKRIDAGLPLYPQTDKDK